MLKFAPSDWPKTLWIVRHGESAGNLARDEAERAGTALIDIEARDVDTPLSPLGHEQAQALAHWFGDMPAGTRPSIIYASPYVRAVQTATHIAAALALSADRVIHDERLREREFGVLDRYTRHGIQQKFPDLAEQLGRVGKFYFRPPGGESWCDVILRLRSIVEILRRDHVGDDVVIVGHEVTVNCFRYLLESLDEARILAIDREGDVPNCSVTAYQLESTPSPAAFRLKLVNHTLPLQSANTEVTVAADVPAGPR